jgi:DNA-directed RNA polymerase omega subunit
MNNVVDSKYRKILIAAQRAKQLKRGARPRLDMPGAKPIRIAIEEVECGLIDFDLKPILVKGESAQMPEPMYAGIV